MFIKNNLGKKEILFEQLVGGDVFLTDKAEFPHYPLMVLEGEIEEGEEKFNCVYLDDGRLEFIPYESIVNPVTATVVLTNCEGKE